MVAPHWWYLGHIQGPLTTGHHLCSALFNTAMGTIVQWWSTYTFWIL